MNYIIFDAPNRFSITVIPVQQIDDRLGGNNILLWQADLVVNVSSNS
ncbi:MAG TPA: hypothetical protein VJ022_12975 [Anaerolineales bacterium]|nr:hypothetical protein [Anaerolineales bacterium]